MVQVPCSKVGHLRKSHTTYEYRKPPFKLEFSNYNLKRLAEVWLDEYKGALYDNDRKLFDSINPGNLSHAFAVKKMLNCKPFKYFLDVIAPDLAEIFPPFELPKFAYGSIYSVAKPSQCFTHVGPKDSTPLKLTKCKSMNHMSPHKTQHFALTWHKTITGKFEWKGIHRNRNCLDMNGNLRILPCHFCFGNQLVKFDLVTKIFYEMVFDLIFFCFQGTRQLINLPKNLCISTDDKYEKLFMSPCNSNDIHQKFNWGYVEIKKLTNWDDEGRKVVKLAYPEIILTRTP